jgi:hypothetical protein
MLPWDDFSSWDDLRRGPGRSVLLRGAWPSRWPGPASRARPQRELRRQVLRSASLLAAPRRTHSRPRSRSISHSRPCLRCRRRSSRSSCRRARSQRQRQRQCCCLHSIWPANAAVPVVLSHASSTYKQPSAALDARSAKQQHPSIRAHRNQLGHAAAGVLYGSAPVELSRRAQPPSRTAQQRSL